MSLPSSACREVCTSVLAETIGLPVSVVPSIGISVSATTRSPAPPPAVRPPANPREITASGWYSARSSRVATSAFALPIPLTMKTSFAPLIPPQYIASDADEGTRCQLPAFSTPRASSGKAKMRARACPGPFSFLLLSATCRSLRFFGHFNAVKALVQSLPF